MTYGPIFMLTVFKLKDQNYSLNNIVKYLNYNFDLLIFNKKVSKNPKFGCIKLLNYKILLSF